MEQRRKRISRRTSSRTNFVLLAFGVVALIIGIRLVYLQIVQYDYFKKQVMNEITIETEVNPERGTIYDAGGNILATNRTVYLCFISPQDIIDGTEEAILKAEETEKKKAEAAEKGEEWKPSKNAPLTEWTDKNGKVHKVTDMDDLIASFLEETLSESFGVKYSEVMEKAAKEGRRYEEIAKELDEETAQKIREFIDKYGLKTQIYLRADSIRYYPYDNLASHVVGFTNSDGIGVYGIEAYYNNLLEGESGRYISAQDANANEMDYKYESFVDAEDGYNIVTTIDSYIQYELENQLEATLRENKAANRVTGVVMNVNTGAVLGMATAPDFNLNDPYVLDKDSQAVLDEYTTSEEREEDARLLAQNNFKYENPDIPSDSEDFDSLVNAHYASQREHFYEQAYSNKYFTLLYAMWKNKAITELYEPGSTSKIITTAMAFEEGVTNPSEVFFCGGSMRVEGYGSPISCHEHRGHGSLPYAKSLQQSCNPALMTVGLRIGREKFYNYFLDFGYGDITGIDLPGEAASYYHSFKDFSNVSLAVYSFGQTYKTTAIQQISAISAIANGGYIVTPHILKEVVDDEGNVIKSYEPEIKRQVVSSEVCTTISEILEDGVSGDGGARNCRVKGYKVAGKTGTSEKIDEKDASGQTYLRVGSSVAYAPADDPEVAVIIICDEPMGGSVYGSVVAAPYVSDLLSAVLPYLGYEPQYTEDELKNIETGVLDYSGYEVEIAKSSITNRGLKAIVVGDGKIVTGQVPEPGSMLNKDNGRVILYTAGTSGEDNLVTVPDVSGKSAEAANRILTNAGLNVSIGGVDDNADATVATQSIAPGTEVPEGTVVKVTLRSTTNVTDD
ncbi:MAG: PASTA domain-containing protein [Clostridia bacterium]|nr:PASTA domain-containing protein [Clostridia bacterium]